MSGAFTGLISRLRGEAEEGKLQVIGLLEHGSRDYAGLQSHLQQYIENRDAADVLEHESQSRTD